MAGEIRRNWEWRIQYLQTAARAERGLATQHMNVAEYFESLATDLEIKLKEGKLDV